MTNIDIQKTKNPIMPKIRIFKRKHFYHTPPMKK